MIHFGYSRRHAYITTVIGTPKGVFHCRESEVVPLLNKLLDQQLRPTFIARYKFS